MWGRKTLLFIIAIVFTIACVPLSKNQTDEADAANGQNTGGGANADSGAAGSDVGEGGADTSASGGEAGGNVPSCTPDNNCVGCEECVDICRCINPQNTVAFCNQLCETGGQAGNSGDDCQCSPGQQITCGCPGDNPDAPSGTQVCESDCMHYGSCDCSGNTGGATGTGGSGTGGTGIGGVSSGGTSGTGGSSSCDWICEPGFRKGCACPGDLLGEMSGVQTCAPDGCSFGTCDLCPSGTGGTGTGGATGVGGSGTGGVIILVDNDGDGYYQNPPAGQRPDCNDANASIHPYALEVCNGIDDNCVNGPDEGLVCGTGGSGTGGASSGGTGGVVILVDNDGDGYYANPPTGLPWDCNDANAGIHPFAVEVCNNADDDCDGLVDEGLVCGTVDYVAVTYTCVSPDGVHDAMEVWHEAKNYGDAWGNDLPRTYPYGPFWNGATTPYALSFAYGEATDGPDNDSVCQSYGWNNIECTVHVPAGSHVAYNGHYGDQGGVQSWMCMGLNGETSGYCIARNAATGEIIPQGWHYWPTTDSCRFEYTAPIH